MNRMELLQRLVLDTISDDFENVDQVILREVAEQGARYGLTVDRFDIVEALRALVEGGLAKAYDLFPGIQDPFSGELPGMPPLEAVEEDFRTYFYITEKGMDFNLKDATAWPFDDEGEFRTGGKPPL